MLNAQRPVVDISRCATLVAQRSAVSTRCLMVDTQHSTLNARCLAHDARFSAVNGHRSVVNSRHSTPDTQRPMVDAHRSTRDTRCSTVDASALNTQRAMLDARRSTLGCVETFGFVCSSGLYPLSIGSAGLQRATSRRAVRSSRRRRYTISASLTLSKYRDALRLNWHTSGHEKISIGVTRLSPGRRWASLSLSIHE